MDRRQFLKWLVLTTPGLYLAPSLVLPYKPKTFYSIPGDMSVEGIMLARKTIDIAEGVIPTVTISGAEYYVVYSKNCLFLHGVDPIPLRYYDVG